MPNSLDAPWKPSNPEGIARGFVKLGWIGFWLQLTLISVPILLLVYVLVTPPDSAERRGIDLGNYLSLGGLAVMAFTTLWSLRYTRLGKQIAQPGVRPPLPSVLRTLWVGVWAGFLGIAFSLLTLIGSVGRLLMVLLATPQTGVPIASAFGDDPRVTLSAIDGVGLMALLVTLTAELFVVLLSVWLLFRVTRPSPGS